MNAEKNNEIVDCTYSVHAVIFGADESLLSTQLNDGFFFKRISLIPSAGHLDSIFNTTDMNLRRDYETARIDETSLDVICAVKEKVYRQAITSLDERFEKDADEDLISLDNQIRAIRLLKEGPVRFKKIAFNQDYKYQAEEYTIPCNHNSINTIGEAMTTKPISTFHCNNTEVASINKELSRLSFPLSDSLLNSCHKYYDLSYHTESCISITLLTAALEILFLERNAKSKRKVLAKRCAAFLYENDAQRLQRAYDNLIAFYDKRSDFVHEGAEASITDTDIISLRAYVRESLLEALSLSENKDQRIARLKQVIAHNSWLLGE